MADGTGIVPFERAFDVISDQREPDFESGTSVIDVALKTGCGGA
jgi:hypothetical protein